MMDPTTGHSIPRRPKPGGVIDVDDPPPIELIKTFDSSEQGSSDGSTNYFETVEHDFPISIIDCGDDDDDILQNVTQDTSSRLQDAVVLYISMGAVFGNVSRVYIGRIFGSDCAVGENNAPDDFLAPVLSHICITNNGLTEQTGGALFIDLPANMIGCLVMGMLAVSKNHPFPWLHRHHHLQRHSALIAGFATGFCGCLTTFASWNTQMVRMLDGTGTELGPQGPEALFGYLIGMCGAISCFLLGRHLHGWWSSIHEMNRDLHNLDDEVGGAAIFRNSQSSRRPKSFFPRCLSSCAATFFSVTTGPPLLIAALTACFLVGGLVYEIPYYREIILETAAAPLGALLRWKLSKLNDDNAKKALPGMSNAATWERIGWVPLGTLAANIIASILSLAFKAIQIRYLGDFDDPWSSEILPALETGFCGSLSTVSTFIKEVVTIESSARSFRYATLSLTMAMLLGLLVFSPIVRS